jgi:hypothetical protein
MRIATIALVALVFLPAGIAQEAGGETDPQDELRQGLDQLGRKAPPPPFDDDDAANLKRLRTELAAMRDAILGEGANPTPEEIAAMEKKADDLIPSVLALQRRQNRWERYQANPTGNWDVEPGVHEYVASDEVPDEPIDLPAFYRLLMRFKIMNSDRQVIDREDPWPTQWKSLAAEFGGVARGQRTISGTAKQECYRLRAANLQGTCILYAAVEHFERGDLDAARRHWEEGISLLHEVDKFFKLAVGLRVDPDNLGLIPAPDPRIIDDLNREEWPPEPYEYSLSSHLIGTGSLRGTQRSTFDDVRDRLADYCPWGIPVWFYLKDVGLTEGFDLRLLRPFGGRDTQKLWAVDLGPAAIPPIVRRHLEDLQTGTFKRGDRTFQLEWDTVHGTSDCTAWFLSPMVRDMTAGELLGIVVKTITVLKCGLIAIAGEFGGDILGRLLEAEHPESWECHVALATATSGSAWEYDEYLKIKREGVSGIGLARSALLKILTTYEKAEMKELFEGICPREDHVQDQIGGQKTYDGTWMPPVVLRAAVSGFEKVPDNEYRRLWVFTRYWLLDPRGFDDERVVSGSQYGGRFGGDAPQLGGKVPWDLSRASVKSLPGQASRFVELLEGSERIWWPVPETGRDWGSQAHVALFEPEFQVIWFRIAPKLLESWKKDCPEGHGLAVVIRFPPPYQERVEVQTHITPDGLAYFGFRDRNRKTPSIAYEGVVWRKEKLFATYDMYVVRGPSAVRWEVDIDSPEVVELARVPVRFINRKDRPITGEIRFRGHDRVDMHLTYDGESDRTFELEPQGGSGQLLPTVLRINGVDDPGTVVPLNKYRDAWELTAALGPVDQAWHTLCVNVRNPAWPAPQDFVIHDLVTRRSAAAVFRGNIPVPTGRSEVTITVPGVDQVTVVVERERPHGWEPVDHADWRRRMTDRLREREEASNERWRLIKHCGYLEAKIDYAEALAKTEKLTSARATLAEVPRELPKAGQMRQVDLEKDYRNLLKRYSRVLAEVAFHQGDAVAMGESGTNYLHLLREEIDRDAQSGKDRSGYYEALGKKWTEFLDRLIVIGGDPALIARLHVEWMEIRRLCGFAKGDYDRRRFRYRQKDY